MAYYSKYSGKEVDERLDRVDSIPTKISQLLNDKDYITEIELKAILDKIPIVDFSKIPIDEDTIYWSENSDGKLVLKSKGGGEDSNWSVKKDSNGNKYIYTELPVVTQYGVTMYGNSGDINLPSLYAGLPIDNQTIYWDNGVLKSLGGGEGLNEEALRNYLLINGYVTESWVLNLGYIGPEGLKNYVDISSNQDINGKKNFKSGISINGLDIYQSQDDVIYIDANLVVRGGITMFSDRGDVDIPSIAQGLPFDNRTIWYNPDTQQIEVIGGTGGGSGEGVSNFWDLSGIPSWITNTKPAYSYTEIQGTPDLSVYALKSYVDDELTKYVTLGDSQEIKGEKDFTGGLKVNGSTITYDKTNKYWKLEGDLLVTGGVTMYGNEGTFSPSTIMDALLYDDTTLGINSNGQLYVKGGTGGGGLDITALQNYLTQNSYLNVISGDNRYLMLSGGTIRGVSGNYTPLIVETKSLPEVWLQFKDTVGSTFIGSDKGQPAVYIEGDHNYLLLHSGNYSNYALPLSGGEISSTSMSPLTINTSKQMIELRLKSNSSIKAYIGWNTTDGVFLQEGESIAYIGVQPNKTPYYFNGTRYTLWHEGNFTPSNYLPLSGGTINGNIQLGDDSSTSYYALLAKQNGNVMSLGLDYGYGTLGYRQSGTTNWNLLSVANKNVLCSFNGGNNWNIIWHSGNDGSGSGLDADLLDGKHLSEIIRYEGYSNKNANKADTPQTITYWAENGGYGSTYGTALNIQGAGSWNNRIAFRTDGKIDYYQGINTGDMSYIGQIAFTSSNVASATKLQTARTIWGQSFDGTGNVDGALTINKATTSSGDYGACVLINGNYTETGFHRALSYENQKMVVGSTAAMYVGAKNTQYNGGFLGFKYVSANSSSNYMSIGLYAANDLLCVLGNGNVGIGTAHPSCKLEINSGDTMSLKLNSSKIDWGFAYNAIGIYHSNVQKGGLGWNSEPAGLSNVGFYFKNYVSGDCISLFNEGGICFIGSNVGIGTTSPAQKLHVNGHIWSDGDIGAQSKIIAYGNIIAKGNIGVGTESPSTKLHVAGNFRTNDVWIGSDTGTYIEGTQTGGLRIQYANSENKYTQIHLKDLTVTINNNLLCSGGITMYSDQRKKTILNHVELSLKQIANAPLIEHYYNSDEKKITHVGSIAQYWANMNDWFCKLDSEGYYTMEIQNAALASAISIARELDRYETKTDKAIKKLKKRICELEEEVERLKSA